MTVPLQRKGLGTPPPWGQRQWAAGKLSRIAQMVLEAAPATLGVPEGQGYDDLCPWRVCWEEQRARGAAGWGGGYSTSAPPLSSSSCAPRPPAVPGPRPFPVECTCPSWGHRKPRETLLCCTDRSGVGMLLAEDASKTGCGRTAADETRPNPAHTCVLFGLQSVF